MSEAPLSAEDYNKRLAVINNKTITLSSGFSYTIKRMTALEFLQARSKYEDEETSTPLVQELYNEMKDVNRDEDEIKKELEAEYEKNTTPLQRVQLMNEVLALCVIDPKMSLVHKKGSVCVHDLPVGEMNELAEACLEFMQCDFRMGETPPTSIPNASEPSEV